MTELCLPLTTLSHFVALPLSSFPCPPLIPCIHHTALLPLPHCPPHLPALCCNAHVFKLWCAPLCPYPSLVPPQGHLPNTWYHTFTPSRSGIKPPPRVRVDQFPVGSVLMNELMPVVVEEVNKAPVLRERLFQVGRGSLKAHHSDVAQG